MYQGLHGLTVSINLETKPHDHPKALNFTNTQSLILLSDLKVLAQRGLAWPNSLSINLETQQIMWVDASRDWIGIMDLDGSNMKV